MTPRPNAKPKPAPDAAAVEDERQRPRQRELGRDGVTVMVNRDRALRAREISQPTEPINPPNHRRVTPAPTLLDHIEGRLGRPDHNY